MPSPKETIAAIDAAIDNHEAETPMPEGPRNGGRVIFAGELTNTLSKQAEKRSKAFMRIARDSGAMGVSRPRGRRN